MAMNALFWMLALAHLIGDYPLQTDWLVSVKRTWWGLSIHVGIHLLILLILAGPTLPILWPFLVGLAAVHYAIDAFKNWLGQVRPRWVTGPYVFDQFLHLLSLITVALWVRTIPVAEQMIAPFLLSTTETAFLIGLLFCTVVWYISERVLSHATPAYQQKVVAHRWQRIAMRALIFLLFLGFGRSAGLTSLPLAALFLYGSPPHRTRAILTDVAVALVAALLVMVAR